MANYASAALVTAQAKLSTKYTEAELRRKTRPVIRMALQNQDYAIPNASELRKRESRPVEVHYKLKKAPGNTTTKATRHTGGVGDSSKITLSWFRLVEKFSFSRKRLQSKVIGAQEAFNHEVDQAVQNLNDRVETEAVAFLYANRCQLLAAGIETNGQGTWKDDLLGLEIAAADESYFIQNSKTFMWGRHYRQSLDLICDLRLYPKLERVRAQGAGNATNTGFQFDGVEIVPITDTINTGLTKGQGLIMPSGYFASMPWNDQLNRQGFGRPDDYVGMLTTMRDPYGLDLSYDVSVWTDREDTSAAEGHEQDIVDNYEFSMCLGFALPPISTADESIVHHVFNAEA